jgi:hypothetical protein
VKGIGRTLPSLIGPGALGLALLLAAPPASAQTWKGLDLERRMRDAAWHFGPFLIQPSLVISNAGVDSNLYYDSADPVKDLTITAGPAATFYVPIHKKKFVLSAYGSPQYVWYSETEQERTWNYYFNGAAQVNLRNAFFSFDAVYSDARERWNTEIDFRPRRKEMGYGSSALLKMAAKTSVLLGYRTVDYDYESVDYEGSDLNEELSHQESFANFSTYYQSALTRRLFLDFEYGRYEFVYETQADLKDAESGAVFGGVEFSELGRRVRGRLRLGYKKFDVWNADLPDYQGLVGDTQLSVRLARMFTIRGSYVRDVRFSLYYDYPYFIETMPGVGASVYFLSFIRLDYDFMHGQNSYPELPGEDITRYDEFDVHSGGVYFRVIRNTAIGFIVSWWARDSNMPGEDDERTFLGFNLTYDF